MHFLAPCYDSPAEVFEGMRGHPYQLLASRDEGVQPRMDTWSGLALVLMREVVAVDVADEEGDAFVIPLEKAILDSLMVALVLLRLERKAWQCSS